jgi:deazaflavin-dependent oxidoreductase (nitroreductase family)
VTSLEHWAAEPFCYLTTVGRRTGRPHRIEIWFAIVDGRLYLLSGGRDRADWVRNVRLNPAVVVELGSSSVDGTARILDDNTPDDALARRLLFEKYSPDEDDLESWSQTSLAVAVAIDLRG